MPRTTAPDTCNNKIIMLLLSAGDKKCRCNYTVLSKLTNEKLKKKKSYYTDFKSSPPR
jgi:hypothetical protein